MGNSFQKNLRAELDYQGLTVKELAAKTNISKHTLDCYLKTKASMPPADAAVKIARALHVSVEYLVTGQNFHSHPPAMEIIASLNKRNKDVIEDLAKILKNKQG